jgi:hypothetical protein
MTSDLAKDIVTRGVPIGDTDLTPLLKIWGFEQRQWRLPGIKTPRRSWCLPDARLAALERELAGDAGKGHDNITALIPAEMLTTSTTTRRRARPRSAGRLHLADLPDADLDLFDGERLASESDDDASGSQEHGEVKSLRRAKRLKTSVKAHARRHDKGTKRD